MTRPTKTSLWYAQLQAYPDSVKLSKRDLYKLLPSVAEEVATCLLDQPHGIFYACVRNTDGTYRYMGYRIGLKREDYVSGFSQTNIKWRKLA